MMQGTVKHIVKKVTLELIYDVVEERTKELNARIDRLDNKIDGLRQEVKEDFKSINSRIDQIHIRLDQIMQMLAERR